MLSLASANDLGSKRCMHSMFQMYKMQTGMLIIPITAFLVGEKKDIIKVYKPPSGM